MSLMQDCLIPQQQKPRIRLNMSSQMQVQQDHSKSKQGQAQDPFTATVSEFVQLSLELKAIEAKAKRREELRKVLQAAAGEFPQNEEVVFTSPAGTAVFSAASRTRTIKDLNGLIGTIKTKVGYEALLAALGLPLTKVDALLAKHESAPFIGEERGPRTIKSVTPA